MAALTAENTRLKKELVKVQRSLAASRELVGEGDARIDVLRGKVAAYQKEQESSTLHKRVAALEKRLQEVETEAIGLRAENKMLHDLVAKALQRG